MRIFFVLSLFFLSILNAETFLFTPPKDWEYADPSKLTKHVHAGFVGKGSKDFRPSLNFASESLNNLSLENYVNAVKELYVSDKTQDILDLGTLSTPIGNGRLLKIQSKNVYGNITILQFLFVHDNHTAYVISGSVIQEEQLQFYKIFLEVFRSIQFTKDLFDPITKPEEKERLKKKYNECLNWLLKEEKNKELSKKGKKICDSFDAFLSKNHSSLGSYWKILVLKKLMEDFLASQK
ncbi:MAG: hypothetical protein WCP39_07555 [Chlamydiota bacterium]